MTTGTPEAAVTGKARLGEEPVIAWPGWRLIGTIAGAAALSAGAWLAAPQLGPWDSGVGVAGVAGAVLVGGLAIVVLLVVRPWKMRPLSAWMNFWIGGTVLRLLLVPAATYLLYSATSLSATPLALSVTLTYLLTLFAEAAVLALYVRRAV